MQPIQASGDNHGGNLSTRMAVQYLEFQLEAWTTLAVKTGMYRVPELLCSLSVSLRSWDASPTLLDQE
ncbi:hypothetical protein N7465_001733 [Penicillium sp. CMV-2018d]|nr:hypothetical protein N7465_001733 [Penicillium sp. CMV-2018d]